MEDPYYPMGLYIFRSDGFHAGPMWLKDEAALDNAKPTIDNAMRERREIRITDPGDNMLFHAQNGRVLWPHPDPEKGN